MRSVLKLPLLLLLCVVATIGNGVAAAGYAPRPLAIAPAATVYDADSLRVSGWAAIVAAPDSVVKLGTVVNNLTGMLAGDTLHFSYWITPAPGTAGADTLVKHVRKLTAKDSLTTAAPAYGKTRHFKGCVEVEMGGRTSGRHWPAAAPMCWTWSYTRDPRPDPNFGPIERLVIRPLPPVLGRDVGGRCAAWQAANPSRSPWIQTNALAVPECTDSLHQLLVWQFCAFAEDTLGRPWKTDPSPDYCEGEFQRWQSERSV